VRVRSARSTLSGRRACLRTFPHPVHPDRWSDGRVRAGNSIALKDGVRRFETRGSVTLPDDLRVSVEEFKKHLIADRGGVDTLTAIEAGYVRRLVDIETVLRLLTNDLSARGLFTLKGRVRSTVSKFFEALDRWDRFASRIGTERKARSVPTLAEYLASRAAERDGLSHEREPSREIPEEESAS
jgi:hypothetical protein